MNENIIFRFGYIDAIDYLDDSISIKQFNENLSINFTNNIKMSKEELVKEVMILQFNFLTQDNQIITKEIKITLSPEEK